jgi:hypothetical protein
MASRVFRLPRTENAFAAAGFVAGFNFIEDLACSHGKPGGDDGGLDVRWSSPENTAADGLDGTVLSELMFFSIVMLAYNRYTSRLNEVMSTLRLSRVDETRPLICKRSSSRRRFIPRPVWPVIRDIPAPSEARRRMTKRDAWDVRSRWPIAQKVNSKPFADKNEKLNLTKLDVSRQSRTLLQDDINTAGGATQRNAAQLPHIPHSPQAVKPRPEV